MLEAENREAVLSWSERQLGARAGLISVLQVEEETPAEGVERSGTGIRLAKDDRGQVKGGFMADPVRQVVGLDPEVNHSFEWYSTAAQSKRKASVH